MGQYLLRNVYVTYHSRGAVPLRFRAALGQREGKRLLHNTVATIWKRQEVHDSIPATLLNHSAGGITYTRYGKGYEIDKLSEVIQLIIYSGLDIQPWGATN